MSTQPQASDLREASQALLSDMMTMTRELCSFSTVNPPGEHFLECAEYLVDQATRMGCTAECLPVPPEYQKQHAPRETWNHPRYNVIARWDTGASRTLHFNSHYDVVPVSDGWVTPPFEPAVSNDRLYGRGTQDMKGCLVASLFAVRILKECGITPPWNIEYSFVCDEEIGGLCGSGYITGEKIVTPDAAVICEGGHGDTVAYGHRGVYWGDVRLKGVSGHGSNPALGHNAFEAGMRFAKALLELHQTHQQQTTRETMASDEFISPTMTLGGCSGGGSKVNIIPETFHFTFDRRMIAEESADDLRREYMELAQSFSQANAPIEVVIDTLMAFNAGRTDPRSWFCHAARDAVSTIRESKAELRMFGAFTDLHFFTNRAGCPSIGYGLEGAGMHGNREFLSIPSLAETAAIYAQLAHAMPEA